MPILRGLALISIVLLSSCSTPAPAPFSCEPVVLSSATARVGQAPGLALLPNGDGLSPIGERILIGQSPLHLAIAPDGKTVALAENGLDQWGVEIASAAPGQPLARLSGGPLHQVHPGGVLRGLAFNAAGDKLYAADTGADRISEFARAPQGTWAFAGSWATQGTWPADLALSADGAWLYVSMALSNEVQAYDPATQTLLAKAHTGGLFPHALLLAGGRVYVAEEGAEASRRNRVEVFDAPSLQLIASYTVGKNPSALAISPDQKTLYVASGDDDLIDRIDLAASVSLQPFMVEMPQDASARAVPGAVQPSALALSPDGRTLYVAAANLNAVLVLDARTGVQRGALPAGWRPMALSVIDEGRGLLVANYRGEGSRPSHAKLAGIPDDVTPGSLQRIQPIPQGEDLAAATQTVARLLAMPLHEIAAVDARCDRAGPLPARPGGDASASRIKHVVVVFKENKTFDEVFGDFAGAEASRELLLWGEKITPNQHELARQFCLLDNFYAESDISLEGHYWMTAQTSTDYFDRVYGLADGDHARTLPIEKIPAGISSIDTPRAGFIWEALGRAGVTYVSFGEFVGLGGDLGRNLDFKYVETPRNQLDRPDTVKLETFLAYVNAGKLPAFSFVEMQWDHTFGVSPGRPAPDYMVADNDAATGRLVEAISQSPYWKDTLILITEDDPASGADHIDRRRSFALVVSPWARRGRVSHVRAAFPSLAATWERALGVKPISRFDGAAEPLWDCLSGDPDFAPFKALASNVAPKISLRGDPGAEESEGLDLSQVDRAPIGPAVWRYMRPHDPMPPSIQLQADRLREKRAQGVQLGPRPPSFRALLRATAGGSPSLALDDDDDD